MKRYDLYLSYSGNMTYGKCPKKYQYSYILKPHVSRDPRDSMFGTTIGKIFEWFYERKIWANEDPVSECMNLVSDAVKWTMNHEKFSVTSDPSFIHNLLKEVRDNIPGAVECIRSNSLVTPLSRAEVDLTTNYHDPGSGLIIKVGGRVDFIHSNDGKNFWILDGKGSKYGSMYVDPNQLVWYALQHYMKFGIAPTRLGFLFWRFPDSPVSWIEYDGKSMESVLANIIDNTKSILNNNFPVAPGSHCKFCDYSQFCDQGKIQIAAMNSEKTICESGTNLDIDLM